MSRSTRWALVLYLAVPACASPAARSIYTPGEMRNLQFSFSRDVPDGAWPLCLVLTANVEGCPLSDGLPLMAQTQYPFLMSELQATRLSTTAPVATTIEVATPGTLRLRSTDCAPQNSNFQLCASSDVCAVSSACTDYPVRVDVEGLVLGTHELIFRGSSGEEIDRVAVTVQPSFPRPLDGGV